MRSKRMFVPLHADSCDHPKLDALADALGIHILMARGIAASLWARSLDQTTPGRWPAIPARLSRLVGWDGDPVALVDALIGAGLLDRTASSEWVVHEWDLYGGRGLDSRDAAAARKRMQREREANQGERGGLGQNVTGTVTGTERDSHRDASPLLSSPLFSSPLEGVQGEDPGAAMLARGREAERLGATIPKPLGRSRGVIGIQERENWPTTEYEALHIPAYGTTLGAYLADQCKALDGRGGRPTVMQAFLEGPWAHWQTMGGDRWAFPVMFIAKTVAWMRDTNAKAKRDQVTDAGAEKRGITTPAMPQPEAEDPKRKAMRVHWDRLGKDGANLPDFAQWVEDMEHAGVLDELSRLQVDADGLVCLHGAPLSRRPAQGITARLAQEALQVASPEEVAEGFALIRQAVAKTAVALAPSSVHEPVGKKKQQGPRDLSAARALLRAK